MGERQRSIAGKEKEGEGVEAFVAIRKDKRN